MDSQELKDFIEDFAATVVEKYERSLAQSREGKSEADIAYHQGSYFAYYDVLDLLRLQLMAFGYDHETFNFKVPELGQNL